MASFTQHAKSKTSSSKTIWCITGPEPILVRTAYDIVMRAHEPSERIHLYASEEYLDKLEQEIAYFAGEEKLAIVVHEAGLVEDWAQVAKILERLNKNLLVIFLSEEIELDKEVLKPLLATSKSRGVFCTRLRLQDWAVWVESTVEIAPEAAAYLQQRSQGDLLWMKNQLDKLKNIRDSGRITRQMVVALCQTTGVPTFTKALMGQRKRAALVSLESGVRDKEFHKLLNETIKTCAVNAQLGNFGAKGAKIATTAYVTEKELAEMRKSSIYYDQQVATRCFTALSALEPMLKAKSPYAFMALVSRW